MEDETINPYVVSADIYLLMKGWANRRGFVLPEQSFFSNLREKFSERMREMFSNFELVSETELVTGLEKLLCARGLPVISLDRAYSSSGLNLEVSRVVDESGKIVGLKNRPGTPSIRDQVELIRQSGVQEATLVDDVIFSGSLMKQIIECLEKEGIHIHLVCAGIGIDEGVKVIENVGCEVKCVRNYTEIIDEVCERDFYPGIPFSGRLLAGEYNFSAPYVHPFGDPIGWASIPVEYAADFSRFCLLQTISLFEKV
ncbi:MAG: hypothetical protein WC178_02415 [Candidatus Paceibacterota bacterium]